MYKDRRLSDSELILGTFFVVCVFICVGLLGSDSAQQTAIGSRGAMSAAATVQTTGATTQTNPQKCVDANTAKVGLETQCKPGCLYKVTVAIFGGKQLEAQYVGNQYPKGAVIYNSFFGGSQAPIICGTGGAAPTINQALVAGGVGDQNSWGSGGLNSVIERAPDATPISQALSSGGQAVNSAVSQTTGGSNSYSPYNPGQSVNPGGSDSWPGTTNSSASNPQTSSSGWPSDVPKDAFGSLPNSATSKTGGYSWNNLPTQQGTYTWQGVEGGLVEYTPGANGQPGKYEFWSTENFNEAYPGTGGSGSLGSATNPPYPNGPPAKPLVPGAIDPEALAYERGTAPSSINDEALAYAGSSPNPGAPVVAGSGGAGYGTAQGPEFSAPASQSVTAEQYNQMRADCGTNGVCLNELSQRYGNSITSPAAASPSSANTSAPSPEIKTSPTGESSIEQYQPCAWGGKYLGSGKYSCPVPTPTAVNAAGVSNSNSLCGSQVMKNLSLWCW